MNINKNLMSRNHSALKRNKSDIKYIVVHYVGALGDAYDNTEYYKNNDIEASADFWVGHDGQIWQGNDYFNYYSWHCGGGRQSSEGGSVYGVCTNRNSVGIEMCVKKKSIATMNATDTDWYFTDATVKATAELVKYLMQELDIDIDHVVRHFDVTGKYCPNPFLDMYHPGEWKKFKQMISGATASEESVDAPTGALHFYMVLKTWEDSESQLGAYSELENAKEACPFGFSVFDSDGTKVFARKAEENKDEIWMGWTIRETGSAGLRCVFGDAGKAYGLQFDYRYGLVPFMQYCVAYNKERYKGFNLYIQMGAGSPNLVYNEGLGNLWKEMYDKYTEEFSQLQLTCAYQQYYVPAKNYILKNYGIDLDEHSPAVKGSVWSMSFRSGQETGAKKWAHTAGLTDEEMMLRAYTTYGSEDAGRWLPQGQLGDALLAYANLEFTTINKTMEGGVIAQNPEPVPSDKPSDKPAEPVQEKGNVVYRVQIGFFNKKANAENKAASYRNKGIDCIAKPKGDGYMIQAGVYEQRVSAEKRVDTLKKNKVLKQQKITPFYFEDAQ